MTVKKAYHNTPVLFLLLYLFLINIVLTGCLSPTTEKNNPKQKEIIQEQEIPFPVYMTYNEFEHHLKYNNDTTYIVNFWATWCEPCLKELPYFEKIIADYKNEKTRVLLVSMDSPKDIKSKLIPFVKKRQLKKSVIALPDINYDNWIKKISTEWDGAIPFTMIFNKSKKIIKSGELEDFEELNALTNEVLRNNPK